MDLCSFNMNWCIHLIKLDGVGPDDNRLHTNTNTTNYTLHRGLRTEDRGQRTEDRGRRKEDRGQRISSWFDLYLFNHWVSFGNDCEVEIVLVKVETVSLPLKLEFETYRLSCFLWSSDWKVEIILFHCTQRNWYKSWCMIQVTKSRNLFVLSLHTYPCALNTSHSTLHTTNWKLYNMQVRVPTVCPHWNNRYHI